MATNLFRRWLRIRFSIRMLLIVVTLAGTASAYYIGSEARIVRQRKAMMQKIAADGGEVGGCSFGGVATILGLDKQIPLLRRKLGDVYVDDLVLPIGVNETPFEEKFNEVRRLFPEATVLFDSSKGTK